MDEIKTFLNENNDLLLSPSSDEIIHPKIVGKYNLERNDVCNQVVDWMLHYLENRKCPFHLAIAIAKNIAQQIDTDIIKENVNLEPGKLNSLTLYAEAIKKLPSACNYFLEHEKEMLSSGSEPYLTSVFAIKNKRRKMEDRHVVHHDLNVLLDLKDMPAHSYYAVFDGHVGIDAASYASAHLHVNIAKHPSFATDTSTAVAEAYKITDKQFLELCNKEGMKSGSTAVCALIREKTVYLSWLGDSQAVLVKAGKPVIVTNPHRPERMDEQKRIEALGGHITNIGVCRVNGVLAVTRALGDPDHKPYISNEPDVTTIHLDGTEDFLILACDGLWDGMSPEDATSALYRNLSESALDEPLDAVAAKLVHQSKLQGSEDNITTVVVFLRDIRAIKEYATELVHQSSSQLNFLGMNGEGNVLHAEGLMNSPCSKPTVLELNATSAKKMKNAANVLSSAGFTDPSYSCPYPGSAIDGLSYQNVSTDNSIFVHHQNLASCLPPEATALSELPTPPIDDIVASQQFENLCSEDLCQGLNSLSSQLHTSVHISDVVSNANSGSLESRKLMDVEQEPAINHTEIKNTSKDIPVGKSVGNDITPDEAIDIASSVVSNTIETAVKCLSSSELCEPIPVSSTQKLNPYAEPFVMKSFIPGDAQTQKEYNVIIETSNRNENLKDVTDLSPPEKTSSESNICVVSSQPNLSGAIVDNRLMDDFTADNFEHQNIVSALTDSKDQSSMLSGDFLMDSSKERSLACEFSLLDLKDPGSRYNAEISEENSQLIDQNLLSNQLNDRPIESEKPDTLQDVSIMSSPDHIFIEKAFDVCLAPVTDPFENMQNLELIVTQDNINIDNTRASSHFDIQDSNINESSKITSQESVSLNAIKIDLSVEDHLKQHLYLPENANSIDQKNVDDVLKTKQQDVEQVLSKHVFNEPHVETNQNVLETNNSAGFLLDTEKALVPDPSIILETVTKDSLTLKINDETISSAAILPSEQVDDCHIETFAVDLQTVPDGVPEAEGVTEDVDSDSEKDGGWSYMKGNTVGSTKPKSNESTTKGLKSANKPDSISKLKKDVLKPATDNKSKPKNVIAVDKNKKPVVEKKTLDVKDRKPARMVPSTLPKSTVEKLTKPTSTVSRVKKEPPTSKITTAAPNKLSRPTAPRNTTLNKPMQSTISTDRKDIAAAKPVGSTLASGNIRPKSALSTHSIKANTRPAGSSTLSKGQPSNQSIKSNIMPATRSATLNRPAASTVPSRVLTKPVSSSKPAAASESKPSAEPKPKQLPNTMKRTVPSALKKPDIKETKDIVNKQISAKNTIGASGKNEVRSATTSNKFSATLNNKPVSTKTRTLVKNDITKKDVPKPAISKLNAKTTASKFSRDITKGKVTKSAPIQEKKIEKIVSDVNEQKVAEITSVCEEEKFIFEVNDKEVAVKEQAETGVISDQILIPVENGVAENVKPVEEIISVANSGSESLL